jgi:hypothetical protein
LFLYNGYMAKKLTAADVAQYFASLTKEQMIDNPAVTAAGRSFVRLRSKTVAGPGRPPSIKHQKGGGCRCADCRREKFPSYQHQAYKK